MDIPIDADVNCTDGLVGKSAYIDVDVISERVTHFVINTKEHGRQIPLGQHLHRPLGRPGRLVSRALHRKNTHGNLVWAADLHWL